MIQSSTTGGLKVAATVAFCFAGGWLIGTTDVSVWQSLQRHFNDAYMNHYVARSGVNIESYLYYVTADNASALNDYAASRSGLVRVEPTRYETLFNVHVDASIKKAAVVELRELDSVSAVFTIPFMCH